MSDAQARFERILGYQFRDRAWLALALTHRSRSANNNNERLEFLGDSLLNFVIADLLFAKFPKEKEGRLSRLRASLVRQDTLASIARDWQLGEFLLMGAGELKSGGYRRDSILADGFEAVLGAMHCDGVGFAEVREHVLRWFGHRLSDIVVDDNLKDAKSRLQEWLQAHRLPLPQYEVVSVQGEDHEQQFLVRCHVPAASAQRSAFTTEGQGSSRRYAEQAAATAALTTLTMPADSRQRR